MNGVWRGLAARPFRLAALLLLGWLYLSLASCVTEAPRQDRVWVPYLSQVAQVDLKGDAAWISPVSDWSYTAAGPLNQRYTEAGLDLRELRRVWFVLEPQPGSQLAAHTLLIFEFEGDRLLGLTVEARKQAGEEYDAIRGVWNVFELSYVWATARDLLTGRAVHLDHDVFMYPLELSQEQQQTLLRQVLARTAELHERPRFYNTLYSNCTNELAKAAGIPWNHAFILTGLSDEYLHEQGFIPGEPFSEANARANIKALVVELNSIDSARDFDFRLLAALRARWDRPAAVWEGRAPADAQLTPISVTSP